MTADDLVVTRRGVRFANRYFPCVIGRNGRTNTKTEGDGATPVGTHIITGCLYRPDRMTPPQNWAQPIRPGDLWSDDKNDRNYNHLVRHPHGFSHENLRRADPLYDLILLTNWNWPDAVRGCGSAIFLHSWRRSGYPTEGCVALRADHFLWICRRVVPGTRLIVT